MTGVPDAPSVPQKRYAPPAVSEPLAARDEAKLKAALTDFFSAYNLVAAAKYQKCLAHLLRTIKDVDKGNDDAQWNALRRTLVRLLKDALALGARADRDAPDYLSKRARIEVRMDSIMVPLKNSWVERWVF
jgi:hypothetical protein